MLIREDGTLSGRLALFVAWRLTNTSSWFHAFIFLTDNFRDRLIVLNLHNLGLQHLRLGEGTSPALGHDPGEGGTDGAFPNKLPPNLPLTPIQPFIKPVLIVLKVPEK